MATTTMPMTRTERTYYAILGAFKPWEKDDSACWHDGKLVRCSSSKHLTPQAAKARRIRKLVSMERWH